MTKLKVSLDVQAMPISALEPRQRSDNGLGEALAALASKLEKPGMFVPVQVEGVKAKSIVAKVHVMRERGILPKNISVAQRRDKIFLVKNNKE